ncbi:uncharacterized protein TNCV_43531 [Trichonephila clavipes]|nr:uncharacterized protein TNCV_43531 [Trichonephila clavipes]
MEYPFQHRLTSYQGGHYKDPVVYRGIDAPKIFIEKLEKDAIEIDNIYKKPKPLLPLTESEKQLYDNANNCYVCGQTFHENNIKSDNDLTEQDILNLSDESDVGYILEVDLEYPSDLHDKHSDFPLAPENKPLPNCKEPRLLTTLEPKTKYVLHYSNLKLYLKLGRGADGGVTSGSEFASQREVFSGRRKREKSLENSHVRAFKADRTTSKRIRYGFITIKSTTLIGLNSTRKNITLPAIRFVEPRRTYIPV